METHKRVVLGVVLSSYVLTALLNAWYGDDPRVSVLALALLVVTIMLVDMYYPHSK